MLSYSSLSGALADERERAIRDKARDAWRRRQRGELKFREATQADAADLLRLARLDSQACPPAGRVIIAVDQGRLVAATSVDTGATIADPFRSTVPIVALLGLRAEQLRAHTPRSERTTLLSLRRLRPRSAPAS
jgi:hypothetical protein